MGSGTNIGYLPERSGDRGGLGPLRKERSTTDHASAVGGVHRAPSPFDSPIRTHPGPGTNQPVGPAAIVHDTPIVDCRGLTPLSMTTTTACSGAF